MRTLIASLALGAALVAASASAAIQPFPAIFKTQIIATNSARIYVLLPQMFKAR